MKVAEYVHRTVKRERKVLAGYLTLAQAFVKTRPSVNSNETLAAWEQWKRDVRAVADALGEMNEDFQYLRFIESCAKWEGK